MNKLVRFFPDTGMGSGYDKLSELAKKHKVILSELNKGEFVVFLNKKRDKMKLCASNDVVLYHRRKEGINPSVIQHIPEYFDGKQFNYDAALTKVMRGSFPKWFEDKK